MDLKKTKGKKNKTGFLPGLEKQRRTSQSFADRNYVVLQQVKLRNYACRLPEKSDTPITKKKKKRTPTIFGL